MKLAVSSVLLIDALATVTLSFAAQVPVSMTGFAFSPETVHVSAGDTVVWTNNGAFLHTSTSGVNGVWDSLWESGDLSPSATYARGFADVGTFNYYCRYHYLSGMTGVVAVGTTGVNDGWDFRAGPDAVVFPNPFRGSTTFRFAAAGSNASSVSVLDATGSLVRTLGARSPAVTWDGRNDQGRAVAPGMYFYRVQNATAQARGKVIMSR